MFNICGVDFVVNFFSNFGRVARHIAIRKITTVGRHSEYLKLRGGQNVKAYI